MKNEVKKTGGGSLTKKQQKIMNSSLFADLALKLGKSASGSKARFDSDGVDTIPPPTKRLASKLPSTPSISESNIFASTSSLPATSGLAGSSSSAVIQAAQIEPANSVDSQDDIFLVYDQNDPEDPLNLSQLSIEENQTGKYHIFRDTNDII